MKSLAGRLSGAVLLLAALTVGCESNEPAAGGKGLSHWKREARLVSFFSFLNSEKDQRRAEAFRRLVEIGEPAVPALVDLFREEGIPVSGDAFNALCNLGPRAQSAVVDLVKMLDGSDAERRREAAWILGCIGPPASSAVPALAPLLHDSDPRLRDVAARSLGQIGEGGLEVLARAGRDADPAVRQGAVDGLATGADDLESIRELLSAALDDPAPAVRARALDTVPFPRTREDNEATADLLVRAMNDPDERVREAASRRFTRTYQSQRDSTGFLVAVLAGGDVGARRHAAWNLGRVREGWKGGYPGAHDDPAVLPALRDALDDPDVAVRSYAAWGVWERDPESRDAVVPILRATTNDAAADDQLRVIVARLLWKITGDAGEILPVLEKGVDAEDRFTRLDAISMIGELGTAARPLRPVLERLKEDRDGDVRDRAARALEKVDPTA